MYSLKIRARNVVIIALVSMILVSPFITLAALSPDIYTDAQLASIYSALSSIIQSLKNSIQNIIAFLQPKALADTGLLGYWAFDEGSGTTATDSSGSGNTGTLINNPTYSSAAPTTFSNPYSLNFNGTNNYIAINNNPLTGSSAFSISAWIKYTYASIAWRSDTVISSYDNAFGDGFLIGLNGDSTGAKLSFTKRYNYTAGVATANTVLPLNQWTHVAGTVASDGTITIYINGTAQTSTGIKIGSLRNTNATYIGGGYSGSSSTVTSFWYGPIDDVRLYNRMLTSDEVAQLASSTPPPSDTTPPTVSITTPSSGATVSGSSVTVSATASDDVGVAGVQFKLDGGNLGAEDTTSPYSITWDTTALSNGSHTLTAVARDATGNTTTSTGVNVTVNNGGPAAPIISAISSGNITSTSATITWTTDVVSDSQVNYGLTSAYGNSTILDGSQVTSHSVVVSGLTASTPCTLR